MSRPIVRRVTSAVLVLAVLCFALPAAAAPAGRAHAGKAPVFLGPSLLDQVLSWLSSVWPGNEPRPQGFREKSGDAAYTDGGTDYSSNPAENERGAMIDPNGGK